MSKKKKIIIISVIVAVLIGTIITIVLLKNKDDKESINNEIVEQQENNEVIEPTQKEYTASTIYYLDKNKVDTMPDNTYAYSSSTCNNDAVINFDENNWKYDITNVTKENTECSIYFITKSDTITITFDYNGGTGNVKTRKVKINDNFGMPPEAFLADYHFVGWFTEKTGGKSVTFWDSVGDKDMTLYAHYETPTYLYDKIVELEKKESDLIKVGNDLRYIGKSPDNYITINTRRYRIIGIIDGYIKVVAEKSGGDTNWNDVKDTNDSNANNWESSTLYKYLNNEKYNGLMDVETKLVRNSNWYVGKVSESDTAKTAYDKEHKEKVKAYIGLISASDYAYAPGEECWNIKLSEIGKTCAYKNWLYMDQDKYGEWTITAREGENGYVFASHGIVEKKGVNKKNSYRISFFLDKSAIIGNISEADGTEKNPYMIVYN